MSNKTIQERVVSACERILQDKLYVCLTEVFKVIGLLQQTHEDNWRKGKSAELETFIQGNSSKKVEAIDCLKKWALENGLMPLKIISYVRTSGPKRRLKYSHDGDPEIESIFQTYYFSSDLTEKELRKLQDKLEEEPELIVFWTVSESQCSKCNQELTKGKFLLMEGDKALCLNCAGLGDLVFLSSGNPKLTRRAKGYSSKSVVVVRYSKSRNRYERQGLLVQSEALKKAESEI
jgi:hypothetical protein